MKFEHKDQEFRPVVITLETQDEVDVLHALTGETGGGFANDLLWKLYNKLDSLSSSKGSEYWTGGLIVKK